MSDPARTATLTTLLAGDDVARRMVVSWPLVRGEPQHRGTATEWARAAGVPPSVAERVAQVLFRHAICRPDHSVDPEATRIVQHFAAEQLRATQRGRR